MNSIIFITHIVTTVFFIIKVGIIFVIFNVFKTNTTHDFATQEK